MTTKMMAILFSSICLFTAFLGCTEEPNQEKMDVKEKFLGSWKDEHFNGNEEWVFTFSDGGMYDTNRTIPGTWRVINDTYVELTISQTPVKYKYSFSDDFQTLVLSATGYGDMSWTYTLKKIK